MLYIEYRKVNHCKLQKIASFSGKEEIYVKVSS